MAITLTVWGQRQALGSWQSHFSFHSFHEVQLADTKIFAAADNGVYVYDFPTRSIIRLTTINGLSTGGVTAISWDPDAEILWVGYENGTIDLIKSEEITSITAIRDADIAGSRKINKFLLAENAVFASSDIGLIRINPGQQAISEVYREIGSEGEAIEAYEAIIIGDELIVNTDKGLLNGSLASNLLDFSNWSSSAPGLENISNLLVYNGQLLVTSGSQLLRLDPNDTLASTPVDIVDISVQGNRLLIATATGLFSWSESSFAPVETGRELTINAISTAEETIVLGTRFMGLQISQGNGPEFISLPKKGPVADNPTKLKITEGSLFLTYQGLQDISNLTSYRYESQWRTLESSEIINDALMWNSEILAATPEGIISLTGASLLESPSTLAVDMAVRQNELWVAFSDEQISLAKFTGSQWITYPDSVTGSTNPQRLFIGDDRALWILKGSQENTGFAVWEPATDSFRQISNSDGLRGNAIRDISFAYDPEVWITSTDGVFTIFDRDLIFEGEIVQEVTLQGEPLLSSFDITSTAIDGGNRKWVGTNDGLWLFDPFVTDQLARFTVENSPLPANQIRDLAYEENTGQLFILTESGLVSYQTDSSVPQQAHEGVRIFPNPVRGNLNGSVGITGVVSNATIKIITPEGQLVRELTANGSTASWDLRDLAGSVVRNGIYLVLSSSADGEETFVGKIAVSR